MFFCFVFSVSPAGLCIRPARPCGCPVRLYVPAARLQSVGQVVRFCRPCISSLRTGQAENGVTVCSSASLSLPSRKNKSVMDIQYLDNFEDRLQQELQRLCVSYGMPAGVLPSSPDIDDRWKALAPAYMADAVEQVAEYPLVSVAWAMYLGAAVAHEWDTCWEQRSHAAYDTYYGSRGFDDMDDHILQQILGFGPDSAESKRFDDMARMCAQTVTDLIRHEQIEPQSPMAFHVFARACRVMFRTGAALELNRLGYRMEKADTSC